MNPTREQLSEKRAAVVGKRIRFLAHGDPDPQPLTPGELGTCISVDDIGTLHVRWDSGRRLGLVTGDRYEIVT